MNTLATSLLFACVGVLLAWALRRPLRRLVGVGPAFCLWLLPPVLGMAAWLPSLRQPATTGMALLDSLPLLDASPTLPGIAWGPILAATWLAGCSLMLVRLLWHGRHLLSQTRPLSPALLDAIQTDIGTLDTRQIRMHPAGPAVTWLPGCRLLLPPDLLQRFSAAQRSQVLAHERMHLARCDHIWTLAAELMLAMLWFFPPAWLAMRRFHLDQELACDAATLRGNPAATATYARALLHGITPPQKPAAITPWLSQPQLTERLTMIRNHPLPAFSRRAGYSSLAVLLASAALAANAAAPAVPTKATTPRTAAAGSAASTDMTPQAPQVYRFKTDASGQLVHVKNGADMGPDAQARINQARNTAARALAQANGAPSTEVVMVPVGTKDSAPQVHHDVYRFKTDAGGQLVHVKNKADMDPAAQARIDQARSSAELLALAKAKGAPGTRVIMVPADPKATNRAAPRDGTQPRVIMVPADTDATNHAVQQGGTQPGITLVPHASPELP